MRERVKNAFKTWHVTHITYYTDDRCTLRPNRLEGEILEVRAMFSLIVAGGCRVPTGPDGQIPHNLLDFM